MVEPVRLQLSRKKGFNLQAWSREVNGLPAVNVARPTKWGNPYDWREWLDGRPRDVFHAAWEAKTWCCERAAQAFEEDIREGMLTLPVHELRGKNLACWCGGRRWSCHADVLLELANRATPDVGERE